MSNWRERLNECADLLHDEGFDRRESPIIDVIAARDEIDRLRAELEAKAEPSRPAAILIAYRDDAEAVDIRAFETEYGPAGSHAYAAKGLEDADYHSVHSWTWHSKSSREHPAV